jgi:hypothetical protein
MEKMQMIIKKKSVITGIVRALDIPVNGVLLPSPVLQRRSAPNPPE